MGEVYRAHDTRLGRTVAIKVLPSTATQDSTARHRFEREARAVATLSDPHICPLFDVGRHEGRDYFVMEYLAGETLAARLSRGRLNFDEALDVADQVARALVAAHRAGIVHRDLKPGNIMLTDGGVRLLDFGLARHTETVSDDSLTKSVPEPLTGTGMILGTLPYMAPEQIEGRAADARTDIFAFGVVLYEMVTGRRAFEGPSHAALIGSILRDDPPSVAKVDPRLPSALDRVVRRCLAKDPAARWQSAEEIQVALAVSPQASRRWLAIAAGAVALTAVGVTLVATQWPSASVVPKVIEIRRVTHEPSHKEIPFTDGKRVYYASWKAGWTGTLLLQAPISGGESAPLPTPIENPALRDVFPGGTELLISGRDGQLYAMPVLGGQPRPLGELRAESATLSLDGRRLAFNQGPDLFVASSDGSGARKLVTAGEGSLQFLRWSPDGQRIRYTVATASHRTLWEVAADGSGAHAILPADWTIACCGAWTADGRYYVFEAERDRDYGLWALPEAGRWTWSGRRNPQPVKLTTNPMRYENNMPAPDGRTVLALGTLPSMGELARFDQPTNQFVSMLRGLSARDLEFSRDGQWIAYINPANETLWRSRADGSERRQLTFPPALASLPRWSPDSTEITYTAGARGSPSHIFVIGAGGGQPRQVSEGSDNDSSFSPNGASVVYANAQPRLQIADLRSHRTSTVPGSEGLFSPRWSPDGTSIAAINPANGHLMLYQISSSRWRDVVPGTVGGFGWPIWTRDGAHIQAQQGTMIVRVRVSDGQIVPVTSLEGVRQVMLEGGAMWIGRAPDDAPLLLRELAPPPEIYALEIEWP